MKWPWWTPSRAQCTEATPITDSAVLVDAERVLLVQSWCAMHADPRRPAQCLRHPELLPEVALASDSSKLCTALHKTPERLIGHIDQQRRKLSGHMQAGAGRLMIYEPDANLCDGAAAVQSNGYLNDDNAPPWDTWIAWLPDGRGRAGCLLAWVPEIFCAAVERGIEVNPEQCIAWYRARS